MSSTKAILCGAVVGSVLVGLIGFCVLAGSLGTLNSASAMLAGSVCRTSGSLPGLSDAAAANARTVAATALNRGDRRAALIALMTGLTESGLRVLANPNDPAGRLYPHQGVGYDHDSLGIFQQRPSWGSAAQRMDPVVSTNLSWTGFCRCQAGGRSPRGRLRRTFRCRRSPTVRTIGSNSARAAVLLRDITRHTASVDCGGADAGTSPDGPRGAHGLPVNYRLPREHLATRRAKR